MTAQNQVNIIGVGDDGPAGLSATAQELVAHASVLLGPADLLRSFHSGHAEQIPTGHRLDDLVHAIATQNKPGMVVLTAGDPLFFGVARYLCDRLGKDRFNVVPHVSAMQLAFARVKESWDEAYLANLDTIPLGRAIDRIRSCEKAGLFTTPDVTPAAIAQQMLDQGIDYFHVYVCENLGSPDERVTRDELTEISKTQFSPLNVVILVRRAGIPDQPVASATGRLLGFPDEAFQKSQPKRGLLTPREVRVVAIAHLDLRPTSIVWDVGAGSGSLSIEAAGLTTHGTVYAIEMDVADFELIKANCQRLKVNNVRPILGQAPDVWHDLPDPNAIFVGGTGRSVTEIALAAWQRLSRQGSLVVNVNSIDNLVDFSRALREQEIDFAVQMIQIADGVDQIDSWRFESRHPTYLMQATKA